MEQEKLQVQEENLFHPNHPDVRDKAAAIGKPEPILENNNVHNIDPEDGTETWTNDVELHDAEAACAEYAAGLVSQIIEAVGSDTMEFTEAEALSTGTNFNGAHQTAILSNVDVHDKAAAIGKPGPILENNNVHNIDPEDGTETWTNDVELHDAEAAWAEYAAGLVSQIIEAVGSDTMEFTEAEALSTGTNFNGAHQTASAGEDTFHSSGCGETERDTSAGACSERGREAGPGDVVHPIASDLAELLVEGATAINQLPEAVAAKLLSDMLDGAGSEHGSTVWMAVRQATAPATGDAATKNDDETAMVGEGEGGGEETSAVVNQVAATLAAALAAAAAAEAAALEWGSDRDDEEGGGGAASAHDEAGAAAAAEAAAAAVEAGEAEEGEYIGDSVDEGDANGAPACGGSDGEYEADFDQLTDAERRRGSLAGGGDAGSPIGPNPPPRGGSGGAGAAEVDRAAAALAAALAAAAVAEAAALDSWGDEEEGDVGEAWGVRDWGGGAGEARGGQELAALLEEGAAAVERLPEAVVAALLAEVSRLASLSLSLFLSLPHMCVYIR
jgi:hypothetical protein